MLKTTIQKSFLLACLISLSIMVWTCHHKFMKLTTLNPILDKNYVYSLPIEENRRKDRLSIQSTRRQELSNYQKETALILSNIEPEKCLLKLDNQDFQSIDKSLDSTELNTTSSEKIPLILTIGKWGPNNQIEGFFESLEMANHIQAKIVLPPFYFHETDTFRGNTLTHVPGELRINTEAISNLVDFKTFEQTCHHQQYAVILGCDITIGSLAKRVYLFQSLTGIKILNQQPEYKSQRKFLKGVQVFIPSSKVAISQQTRLLEQSNVNILDLNYHDLFRLVSAKYECLIFVEPYQSISDTNINDISTLTALNTPLNNFEYSRVIRTIRAQFLQHHGSLAVGAHWRYNSGDWSNRCRPGWGKSKNKTNPLECQIMPYLNFNKVAYNFNQLALKIGRHPSDQLSNIYIAAPIEEMDTINKIKERSEHKVNLLTLIDLLKFIDQNFYHCAWWHNYRGEVVSLTEQALLTSAEYFLWWPVSSWSYRILDLRNKIREENNKSQPENQSLMRIIASKFFNS